MPAAPPTVGGCDPRGAALRHRAPAATAPPHRLPHPNAAYSSEGGAHCHRRRAYAARGCAQSPPRAHRQAAAVRPWFAARALRLPMGT
eukprot:4724860-Prymnesium_polylepis.1